jgi:hypothetical protein
MAVSILLCDEISYASRKLLECHGVEVNPGNGGSIDEVLSGFCASWFRPGAAQHGVAESLVAGS